MILKNSPSPLGEEGMKIVIENEEGSVFLKDTAFFIFYQLCNVTYFTATSVVLSQTP